jgi:fructose-1,6-bisphosphatase
LGYARHWKEAKNVDIFIPIDKNGKFDLLAQKEISNKYYKISQVKKSISEELEKIIELEISYE